jgi:hypothetical protein
MVDGNYALAARLPAAMLSGMLWAGVILPDHPDDRERGKPPHNAVARLIIGTCTLGFTREGALRATLMRTAALWCTPRLQPTLEGYES